jgi:uncharacterized protein (TIGR02145 family)
MKKKYFIYLIIVPLFSIALNANSQPYGSFTDPRNGKKYKTVKIGDQVWMAANLAYKTSSGCSAYDLNLNNVKKYGYLYTWEVACKACPNGWRLPTIADWDTLAEFLGGKPIAGYALKDTVEWESSYNVTNQSGFSALPGGRSTGQVEFFKDMGSIGNWWTTNVSQSTAGAFYLSSGSGLLDWNRIDRLCKLSVRCIKK